MNTKGMFILALIKRIKDDQISALASQMAYRLLLSFFPFLIFLLTIIAYTPLRSVDLLAFLQGIIPGEALTLVEHTVKEITEVRKGDLLSFSLLGTVWAASGGAKAVIRALNTAYDEEEKRSFLKVQLLSVVFTLGLVIALLATTILLVFGNLLGDYLSQFNKVSFAVMPMWNMFRYVVMAAFMIAAFTFIYQYTPSRRLKFREVLPGSLFSTAGWIIISIAFSFYVDNFANYSSLYGGIAAIFILMIWIYLSSIILLIGGEINATLAYENTRNN
ncbi:ribonuclease BN/unknown domain fusion protein [Clostridium sp. N3C]|uniref:YihY/virulence factor BrkB family protein n=1 Tax=Clostridium sp. N3C TaxID=1776758 RepID=UPI00092E181D|nr:YihY/virulence factor BrkB family protein [Clostridium sp. N3C]SCN25729.1 ribonuclease BN/unknown domain fusion protein [Clostridium sp. N3C]